MKKFQNKEKEIRVLLPEDTKVTRNMIKLVDRAKSRVGETKNR